MKKILVISDVHGSINILEEILKKNNDVDLKIFAGDLQNKNWTTLKNFDYVVRGNSDYYEESIPEYQIFDFCGIKIFLTHGHLFGSIFKKINFETLYEFAIEKNINLIVHGHDHIKAKEKKNNIFRFNPGSTTFPRDSYKGSYGIIHIKDNKIHKLEHKYI